MLSRACQGSFFRPGARFSKAPETFRARKAIFSSSVSKNGEMYKPETSCMKGTSVHIKNRWIKQLCNRKVRDFAMAFRARKVPGTFEKRAPDQLFSRATQRLHCFPRLTLVAPFPGLGNGRVLSRAWHRSHDLAWSSNWSDVWLLWLRFYFRTDRCTWRWSGWHWRLISFISFFCVGIVSPQTVHLKQRQDKLWLDFFFDLRVTCMLNNFFTKITFAAFGMAYKAKLNIFRRLFEIIPMLLIHFRGNFRTLATESSIIPRVPKSARQPFKRFWSFRNVMRRFPMKIWRDRIKSFLDWWLPQTWLF